MILDSGLLFWATLRNDLYCVEWGVKLYSLNLYCNKNFLVKFVQKGVQCFILRHQQANKPYKRGLGSIHERIRFRLEYRHVTLI